MSSKPLEVWVPITELLTLVEKKSKQTDLNGTPEPMSLPINDLSYTFFHIWIATIATQPNGNSSVLENIRSLGLNMGVICLSPKSVVAASLCICLSTIFSL